MKKPTFKEAREKLLAYLQAHGWAIQLRSAKTFKPLKEPRAIHPSGLVLHFHPQAVYYSHDAQDAGHSLFSDIREITGERLCEAALRRAR